MRDKISRRPTRLMFAFLHLVELASRMSGIDKLLAWLES